MIIYLAQPYSINSDEKLREERYQVAVKKVAEYMNQGYNVFSPILNSHMPSVQYGLPCTFSYWENVDYEYISVCGEVWVLMLEGWKESVGVRKEIAFAEEKGIPVRYIKIE